MVSPLLGTKRHKEAQGGTRRQKGLWKGKRKKKRQKRRRERGRDEEEGEKKINKKIVCDGCIKIGAN